MSPFNDGKVLYAWQLNHLLQTGNENLMALGQYGLFRPAYLDGNAFFNYQFQAAQFTIKNLFAVNKFGRLFKIHNPNGPNGIGDKLVIRLQKPEQNIEPQLQWSNNAPDMNDPEILFLGSKSHDGFKLELPAMSMDSWDELKNTFDTFKTTISQYQKKLIDYNQSIRQPGYIIDSVIGLCFEIRDLPSCASTKDFNWICRKLLREVISFYLALDHAAVDNLTKARDRFCQYSETQNPGQFISTQNLREPLNCLLPIYKQLGSDFMSISADKLKGYLATMKKHFDQESVLCTQLNIKRRRVDPGNPRYIVERVLIDYNIGAPAHKRICVILNLNNPQPPEFQLETITLWYNSHSYPAERVDTRRLQFTLDHNETDTVLLDIPRAFFMQYLNDIPPVIEIIER